MSDLVKRLHKMCEYDSVLAADRIERLEAVLVQVRRCAYPVSTDIDPRGYSWSEAYLDQAIAAIDAALKE